jgi:methionyl-tRNA formyltransferase
MKVCIAGKNSIAVYGMLKALAAVGAKNLSVCLNQSDTPGPSFQPSLRRFAIEHGVAIKKIQECYEVDLFLSLEFDCIVDPEKFRNAQLYNIHFSKLPAYKGVYTSAWPILNHARESAVTLHQIDRGIDTGPIFDQLAFRLDSVETARSLYYKYLAHAETLLDRNLEGLLAGNLTGTPQASSGSSYYSRRSIDYAAGINFRQTAFQLDAQIRALTFREFQTPKIARFAVASTGRFGPASRNAPGTVTFANADEVVVATVDYDLHCSRDYTEELFEAVRQGDGVDAVLENGPNPNVHDRHGWTPLIIACYQNDLASVNTLLRHGADPCLANPNGTTPLMYAKETGSLELLSRLLDAGADVAQCDRFGRAILEYASRAQQNDIVRFLESARLH